MWHRRLRAACTVAGALIALIGSSAAVAAGDGTRWWALFEQLPALPATAAQAVPMIAAQPPRTEGLAFAQVRIGVADARLRAAQQAIDDLHEPLRQASAEQFRRTLQRANDDTAFNEMARKIERAWVPDPTRPDGLPSAASQREWLKEIERTLGPLPEPPARAASAPPRPPNAGPFLQRLADEQRRFATLHAQADRDAAAARGPAAVAQHHALAQQQLDSAAAMWHEARNTLAPRIRELTTQLDQAEQRGAPAPERVALASTLKAHLEALLTIQRETVQDVGFWAATQPVPGAPARYELSLAPGFDLRADGKLPFGLPHYPGGRTIVVGLAPGIR
jgi:hypothetical protein